MTKDNPREKEDHRDSDIRILQQEIRDLKMYNRILESEKSILQGLVHRFIDRCCDA